MAWPLTALFAAAVVTVLDPGVTCAFDVSAWLATMTAESVAAAWVLPTCAAIVIDAGVPNVILVLAVVGSPHPYPHSSRSAAPFGVIADPATEVTADAPLLFVRTVTPSSGVPLSAP
jgi:hypothetical protein